MDPNFCGCCACSRAITPRGLSASSQAAGVLTYLQCLRCAGGPHRDAVGVMLNSIPTTCLLGLLACARLVEQAMATVITPHRIAPQATM